MQQMQTQTRSHRLLGLPFGAANFAAVEYCAKFCHRGEEFIRPNFFGTTNDFSFNCHFQHCWHCWTEKLNNFTLNSLESISSINALWAALDACRFFNFFMSSLLGFWYELNTVLISLLRTRCVTNVPMNLRLFNIIALSTFICTLYLSFKASAIKAKKKSRNNNDFSILEKNFGLTAMSIASTGLSDLSLVMRGSEILIGIRNELGSSEFRMAVN
uniref:Uncharacterized protein n=1 Tax=Glossina pallidipes TaxID=7398 RepID=A0A1B0AEP3_GLOPL